MAEGDLTRDQILEHAVKIANDWRRRGFTLTLRQLYYQFVGQGITGSGDAIYKRIGSVVTDARYDGSFPIELLEDRERHVGAGSYTRTFEDMDEERAISEANQIVGAIPEFLVKRDRWVGQPVHVSVWVEKKALEGVLSTPCHGLGVGLFACKGYPSVSSLYEWIKSTYFVINGEHPDSGRSFESEREYSFGHNFDWTENHTGGAASEAVVLYFGDHDPDGWEIPRSAERGIRKLQETYKMRFPFRFERIALNMDLIQKYNPPPFEAKMTSARHAKYIAEHKTTDAWELDALDPSVLDQLVRDNIARYFDAGTHLENQAAVKEHRARVRAGMQEA